jgi:hypothetical protein
MDAATGNPSWWIDWLVVGPVLLLWVLIIPTYVGGRILRLAVGLHNAAEGADDVPMPDRGQAMAVVFLATLFNVLVTWSYINSFSQGPKVPGARMSRDSGEEQEADPDEVPQSQAQQVVARAILALRAILLGFALLILTRLLLPTTPWRAFLVTGNSWLIGSAMLAVVFFLFKVDELVPKRF